jgi:serine/threonine protein kinase
VKVAFSTEIDSWVDQDSAALTRLQGLEGVPALEEVLVFNDASTRGVAYAYNGALSLQERFEQGNALQTADVHSVTSSLLKILGEAHKRGVIHCDLQPKDILIPSLEAGSGMSVCGWSRASFQALTQGKGPGTAPTDGLVKHAKRLAQQGPMPEPRISGKLSLCEPMSGGSISIYSAPEQLVGLYFGSNDCYFGATDIYRAAGVLLAGITGHGPMKTASICAVAGADGEFEALRRISKEALFLRASGKETSQQLHEQLYEILEKALQGEANLAGVQPTLAQWFSRCLHREPSKRPQSASEALEALDETWSVLEIQLLEERQAAEEKEREAEEEAALKAEKKPMRIVFEPPPELEEMEVY